MATREAAFGPPLFLPGAHLSPGAGWPMALPCRLPGHILRLQRPHPGRVARASGCMPAGLVDPAVFRTACACGDWRCFVSGSGRCGNGRNRTCLEGLP